jgi:hypothetical protein
MRLSPKRSARLNNHGMNLEFVSELNVNTSCPITDSRVEERYWKNKMLAV